MLEVAGAPAPEAQQPLAAEPHVRAEPASPAQRRHADIRSGLLRAAGEVGTQQAQDIMEHAQSMRRIATAHSSLPDVVTYDMAYAEFVRLHTAVRAMCIALNALDDFV